MASTNCCPSDAPVVSAEYTPVGEFIEVDGLKIYQTGSPEATKAIIVFHDIFGYTPQTLQGTDLLAKTSGYLVFVPDFFHGKPAERDWYPPDSPEKMEKLGAWVQVQDPPEKSAEVIWGLVKALTQRSAGKIEKWGGLGMCFGARPTSHAARLGTPLAAIAHTSPYMPDSDDATWITVPILILASAEEDTKILKDFESKLSVNNRVEIYSDMVHGWMSARADLNDKAVQMEFERGYAAAADFFMQYM